MSFSPYNETMYDTWNYTNYVNKLCICLLCSWNMFLCTWHNNRQLLMSHSSQYDGPHVTCPPVRWDIFCSTAKLYVRCPFSCHHQWHRNQSGQELNIGLLGASYHAALLCTHVSMSPLVMSQKMASVDNWYLRDNHLLFDHEIQIDINTLLRLNILLRKQTKYCGKLMHLNNITYASRNLFTVRVAYSSTQ